MHAPFGPVESVAASPFQPGNDEAWRRWRDRKLTIRPRSLSELIVEVKDPCQLTTAERSALLERCRRANFALYVSGALDEDKSIPRLLGAQFGLHSLDSNYLADEDGISSLQVAAHGERGEFIPYTSRAIKWHTDGYYNPLPLQVRGFILHCVRSAESGGDNALMDHEMAYLHLRDENPDWIKALLHPEAMTIPPRRDAQGIARPAQAGPVFTMLPGGGLHMRYTARTVSIEWRKDPDTQGAVKALEVLLASGSPDVFRGRLEPGMGLIGNNILHDRAAFTDAADAPRLLYRARYHDRIRGTEDNWAL